MSRFTHAMDKQARMESTPAPEMSARILEIAHELIIAGDNRPAAFVLSDATFQAIREWREST